MIGLPGLSLLPGANLPFEVRPLSVLTVDPDTAYEAIQEAERELSFRSLHHYARLAWREMFPAEEFVDGLHIHAICDHLQAITEGRLEKDLVINIPPGHMKSLLVNVIWPTWEWGPRGLAHHSWMFASHSQELVFRDATRRRNLMDSEWFQGHWPIQWRDDTNRLRRYENTSGGWMFSTTVGGQGTGEHPKRICIDDPHDTEKGVTDKALEETEGWFTGKIASRGIGMDVRRVLVMQRVDMADMTAVVIRVEGKRWERLILPAEYEPENRCQTSIGWQDWRTKAGEILWPQFFTPDRYERLKLPMTEATIASQLQQRPPKQRADSDWPAEWFEDARLFVPSFPPDIEIQHRVVSVDPSLGETESSDFCAIFDCRLANNGTVYAECQIERIDPDTIAGRTVANARRNRAASVVFESNGFQRVMETLIQLKAHESGMVLPLSLVNHSGNKRMRILSALTALWKRGEIKIVDNGGHARLLQRQLIAFPAGHDDGPDALAMGVTELRRLWSGEEA